MKRQGCWSVFCMMGWEGCSLEWLGPDRDEMWAVCVACGKRRVLITHFDELKRFPATASGKETT